MANTLAEIVNILTQIRIGSLIAEGVGIEIPASVKNAETVAANLLASAQTLTVPDHLSADLADAATFANALTPLLAGTSLAKIVTAVQSIRATNANLANGQLAIIGVVDASFSGSQDKVVIAAYRESGEFAKIVNQGVTDTNNVV